MVFTNNVAGYGTQGDREKGFSVWGKPSQKRGYCFVLGFMVSLVSRFFSEWFICRTFSGV